MKTNRLARLTVCVLGSFFVAACGSSPPGNAPDYEVDLTNVRPPSKTNDDAAAPDPTPSGTTGQGPSGPSGETPAPAPAPTTPAPAPTTPAPAPTTPAPAMPAATAKVDGVALTVDATQLWVDAGKVGVFDLFVKVSATGLGAGSDFHVAATHVGSGCDGSANTIAYRPANDLQYLPKSTMEPDCSLIIDELPTAIGGHFRGSFRAPLYGLNAPAPTSKNIELVFDVVRTN